MALYEHVFLARQDVTAQQVEALVEQYKGIIEAGGGSLAKSEYWGVKSLTYRIRKNRKAHFQLFNIDAPHAAVAEMERQMSLNEDVVRFLTVRVEAHEEGPSAMMRRREDGDRRDRDGGFERGGFGGGDRFGGRDRGERFGGGGGGGDRFGSRPPRREEAETAEPEAN